MAKADRVLKKVVQVCLNNSDYGWLNEYTAKNDMTLSEGIRHMIKQERCRVGDTDGDTVFYGVSIPESKCFDYAYYAYERKQTMEDFIDDACRYFIRCIDQDNLGGTA